MKCLVCSAEADKYSSEGMKWDWFTGMMKQTAHFCPNHKDSEYRNKLFAIREDRDRLRELNLLDPRFEEKPKISLARELGLTNKQEPRP
jgi:hypothetical protein